MARRERKEDLRKEVVNEERRKVADNAYHKAIAEGQAREHRASYAGRMARLAWEMKNGKNLIRVWARG